MSGRPGGPGSVPGHAPTNIRGHPSTLQRNQATHRQFGAPGGNSREHNGARATAQHRYCLEAIQKLERLDDKDAIERVCKRFPKRMVLRLIALQMAAEDPASIFFLQAQRQIWTMMVAPVRKEDKADEMAAREAESIEVYVGRLEVPMPGAPGDVPPATETKAG